MGQKYSRKYEGGLPSFNPRLRAMFALNNPPAVFFFFQRGKRREGLTASHVKQ